MNLRISVKQLCSLIFVFAFTFISPGFNASLAYQAKHEIQVQLNQFDMMTEASGWVLFDQQLFWTSDAGQTWTDISPSVPEDASVEDVQFIDSNRGWLLATIPDPNGGALFQLSQTNDGGVSWGTRALSLFESSEFASYAEKAEMGWFDLQNGWISVKQTSGSNFSLGTLFKTSDGGNSWSRFPLPAADRVHFSDAYTGWAIRRPTNDQIFRTQDAGVTWENVGPADIPEDTQTVIYPPVTSGRHGLFVMASEGAENALKVYILQNSSDRWSISDQSDQVKLDLQPGTIALSILDEQNFVAVIPGTKSIVRMTNGQLVQLENTDGLSASIVELDMVSMEVGWAKWIDSRCVTASLSDLGHASVSCSSTTSLLHTTDGGATWQKVDLPIAHTNRSSVNSASITNSMASSAVANGENTMAVIGQGFDRCEIPTLSQMQTWSVHSPYESVNLYIGGSNRACNNHALISSYLFQLYQQGWKFFPTWVGPQAPCTGYLSRMSSDVTTAFQQGVNEANLAVERLAQLGLTGPSKTGSVVYYDMENYGTNAACRSAVNAFMNGWVSQLHTRGNLAGVYGSTLCNTGLSDFQNITHVPDVIWPARWYHNLGEGYYDPSANVWNLGSCLPNTAWSNHQRIRQYEGDHNETWGSLTLDIDSNVLDGVVAIPYDYPFVGSIVAIDPNPTNAVRVDFRINFSKSVTGVNEADFSLTTTGSISGVSITDVTGSENIYTVTVDTGSGTGTIRLNVLDDDSIRDGSNQPLGGSGTGNGNFTGGETYTITEPPNVNVYIGTELKGQYFVAQNESTRQSFAGINNGPVKITNTETNSMIAAERVIYKINGVNTSFSETMGLPDSQLDNTYWLPWYNNVDLDTQLRFGNVSGSTATVHVYIGDSEMVGSPFSLIPGESTRKSFAGINNGPVKIISNVDIVAAERVIYKINGVNTSFSEMMALPNSQLDTTYWLPWYNNVNLDTQLRFANVSGAEASVHVYIGDAEMLGSPFTLEAGASTRMSFAGINNGPVKIESNVDIVAAERLIYMVNGVNTSFSEMMALPASQLDTTYWLPWYNNVDLDTQLRFANVSGTEASVHVSIGGVEMPGSPFTLTSGQSTRQSFAGVNNGPVEIVSDVDIVVAERVIYKVNEVPTSFTEMMGLPATQLDTTYWLPWYNNVDLDTQLRFGVP